MIVVLAIKTQLHSFIDRFVKIAENWKPLGYYYKCKTQDVLVDSPWPVSCRHDNLHQQWSKWGLHSHMHFFHFTILWNVQIFKRRFVLGHMKMYKKVSMESHLLNHQVL
jgi:hypothetical protein